MNKCFGIIAPSSWHLSSFLQRLSTITTKATFLILCLSLSHSFYMFRLLYSNSQCYIQSAMLFKFLKQHIFFFFFKIKNEVSWKHLISAVVYVGNSIKALASTWINVQISSKSFHYKQFLFWIVQVYFQTLIHSRSMLYNFCL